MTYAIDPELDALLALLPATDVGYPLKARADLRSFIDRLPAPSLDGLLVDNALVRSLTEDHEVPVRVYRPAGQADAPRPAILYIHGGGFVTGDLDTEEGSAATLARALEAVVVSVDYRLAPEHPYPAALEDCYTTLVWLGQQADELGLDPTRIAVHGQSAGGGLAAAVALLTRDRSGPQLVFQFLGIPELDDRLQTVSMRAYVDTPVWHLANAEKSWAAYLRKTTQPGSPDVPVYAAPARAENLTGLPPTCVTLCQFDPLRDEGMEYARRLAQANVPVELHLYPGTFHGAAALPQTAVSQRMNADTLEVLKRAFGLETPEVPAVVGAAE
ncbi:alpha/beta hydrolase [Streptomyces sp. NPDC050535]|uniref:alpha/beta hydrolase n=1 Tax=Streptomyces sp. NPDC050535 TaxID=3365626 RepID=UPI0037971EAE